jgi:pimeloyl-ACP methyl ester carboxylesterase
LWRKVEYGCFVDPDAMARLRATFIDGMEGWVDDSLAFTRPWGFDLATITVPVGIWRGTDDANVCPEHADYVVTHIATAQSHVYNGGHLPGAGRVSRDLRLAAQRTRALLGRCCLCG